ncbi:hypothetical protein BAC3_01321 [uncultured bacterium]|nr:hypothetical protein BAC3_01321 [uncultured bacterium]
MLVIPKKVQERLVNGIKRFQPILIAAKNRDVNESDTVIIVTDMLSELFGYDKYSEITSEYSIRSTFCDLATKINEKLQLLIEVKAIGLDLKDSFVKQAVDYAANQGSDYVILTNGIIWRVYKISFAKPVNQELVLEFDITLINIKSIDQLQQLFFITKEGWQKSSLDLYHEQRQALSRFMISALILSDPVLDLLRKQLRTISPDIKIDSSQIFNVLINEVLKREVVEGEKSDEARKKLQKTLNKINKNKPTRQSREPAPQVEETPIQSEQSNLIIE